MNAAARQHDRICPRRGRPRVCFSVEIKTVNGRGLDLRIASAAGFDGFEPEIRRL